MEDFDQMCENCKILFFKVAAKIAYEHTEEHSKRVKRGIELKKRLLS